MIGCAATVKVLELTLAKKVKEEMVSQVNNLAVKDQFYKKSIFGSFCSSHHTRVSHLRVRDLLLIITRF